MRIYDKLLTIYKDDIVRLKDKELKEQFEKIMNNFYKEEYVKGREMVQTIKNEQESLATIRKALDLKIDEEFNIIADEILVDCPYKFTKDGLTNRNGKASAVSMLAFILTGACTIEKIPQKPKAGDDVWFIDPSVQLGYLNIRNYIKPKSSILLTDFFDSRGVSHFKTEEEVKEVVERLGWKI